MVVASVSVVEGEFNDLLDLKPVAEALASHEALVGFNQEFLDASNLLLRDVNRALSPSDIGGLLNKFLSDRDSFAQRAESACFDIQALAGRNGIRADLRCF